MDKVMCDWCKTETDNWIIAFDGRKICKDIEPCHKVGAHVSHSVKKES